MCLIEGMREHTRYQEKGEARAHDEHHDHGEAHIPRETEAHIPRERPTLEKERERERGK